MRALGTLMAIAIAGGSLGGCYVEPVQLVTVEQSARFSPPAAVDVYSEARPGYVYVNGRYAFVNGAWIWQRGFYAPERSGFVFVQGYWNGGRWYEGHWEPQRAGYVHTGGYWERRGRGYQWIPGGWERERAGRRYVRGGWVAAPGGSRAWQHGRWE